MCFSFCWTSHDAKRPVHANNVLWDVAADTLELNTDGFHVWDGRLPNGTAAHNWKASVEQLAREFGGGLEILALAATLDHTFHIVRPRQPTVQIGKGKATLWLLLQNRHDEPLSTSADKAAVACRCAKSIVRPHSQTRRSVKCGSDASSLCAFSPACPSPPHELGSLAAWSSVESTRSALVEASPRPVNALRRVLLTTK